MSDGRRLDSLEGLRFLSSLAIVAGHYIPYATGGPGLLHRLHLAVDLFFVISGIVIAHGYAGRITSGGDYLGFMWKRLARLYPLHLATLLFYVAIGMLVWSGRVQPADAARYDAGAIVPNLLLVHAWLPTGTISFNYVSWSISAELFVYLAFPLIALAVRGRALVSLAGILGLFAVLAWVAETYIGLPLTRLGWQGGIVRALPGFAFGVWLQAHGGRLMAGLGPVRIVWGLHGLLAMLTVLMVVRIDQYATLGVIWGVVALAYAADRDGVRTWVSAQWLASRGPLTYSLYMLHPLVATVLLAAVFPKLLGTDPVARIAGVILAIPVLWGLAWASLRWFETPARRAINAWGARRLGLEAGRLTSGGELALPPVKKAAGPRP